MTGVLVTNSAGASVDCSNYVYKQLYTQECGYTETADDNTFTYLSIGGGVLAAGAAVIALISGDSSSKTTTISHNDNSQYYARTINPTTIMRTSIGGDISANQLSTVISSRDYNRNANQYDDIQLAYSIARGYTGYGTTIAVFDTALNTRAQHAEYVMLTANGPIAPNATIQHHAVARDTDDFMTYYEIGNVIASTAGANVYNNSWNAPHDASTITTRNQLANLTDQNFINAVSNAAVYQDAIFVWAAGNDSSVQSGLLSSMPLVMPELNGHFVNVVAWDSDTSTLAEYSNSCGVTQNYCITAPGTIKMPNGRTMRGTSFAAPVVSAAIAVIREAWNYLDSATITQILFDTATDLGEAGVDEVYGHGMLDLEAATRPVGTPTIAISETVSQPLQVARASTQIAQSIKSANPTMAFFDKYGREFETNVADNISVQNYGLGFERLRGDDARTKVSLGNVEFGFYRNDMLSGTGFLQTDSDTTTTYIATNKSFHFGNVELFGRTQVGIARPQASTESIISNFSNIYTASAYVGLRGEKWSLSVGIPDTIVNGTMDLHLATGRNNKGTIIYHDYTIDMTSTPAIEYTANYRFLTAGFVDNPYGQNEFYFFAKTKLSF